MHSSTPFVSGASALNTAKHNEFRSTTKKFSEFSQFLEVKHPPKFKLKHSDKFFTIGSCFARNVENQLRSLGINLLSDLKSIRGSAFEIGGADRTGYQNVYTPGSVLEMFKLREHQDKFHSMIVVDDQYVDLLTSGLKPLSKDETFEIRQTLIESYDKASSADVIIITLGYNEAWHYQPANSWINRTPSTSFLRRAIEDFNFCILDYNTVINQLSEIIGLIKKISPSCKVIFSVSPVPLSSTFSNYDVVMANQLSKSTLLTAAAHMRDKHDFVDYFPSYEMIINSSRDFSFEPDNIHIKQDAIKLVMKNFIENCFEM